MSRTLAVVATSAALLVMVALPRAQAPAPSSYDAVTDRGPRPKPALIALGPAGFSFKDPVFGSVIWRVTDRLTRPDKPDRSYRTPSASHQNAWSASGSRFYVVSTDGTVLPFAFDPETGHTTKLDALRFYIEPQFSHVNDSVIYGSVSGTSQTIDQYDFSTGQYTRLLDLTTLEPGLAGTFVGGVASSSGATERVVAFFGGASQDRHHFVVILDRNAPQNHHVLDTVASTLDGKPVGSVLNFHLHHAAIDRTGRYVLLYPPDPDLAAPRNAAQINVWDTVTNTITPLPVASARAGGHDAYGYGVGVNKDCCSASPYDAAQWQLRSLALPLAPHDLIEQVLTPPEIYMSDHSSWNNAQPNRAVPFISATYRYGSNTVEWRPWDDEILAVPTDGGPDVWRFAHHRSDVRNDQSPTDISFWYTPRPNVSPDGRWVIFTSNWEKTLGTDPLEAVGEKARQDVFLLQLKPIGTEDDTPLTITTATLPDAKLKVAYTASLLASRTKVSWTVSGGALPPGLSLSPTGQITGIPTKTGGWFARITASDGSSTDVHLFLLVVRK